MIDPTCCAVPDPKSWRIYLVLETGASNRLRAFSIQDLEDISGSQNVQALLLGDDLGDPMSKITASPIGQAIQNSGKLLDMWAPWHVGNPQSSGYDSHTSPNLRVIDEIVHYNIPMMGGGGLFLPFIVR